MSLYEDLPPPTRTDDTVTTTTATTTAFKYVPTPLDALKETSSTTATTTTASNATSAPDKAQTSSSTTTTGSGWAATTRLMAPVPRRVPARRPAVGTSNAATAVALLAAGGNMAQGRKSGTAASGIGSVQQSHSQHHHGTSQPRSRPLPRFAQRALALAHQHQHRGHRNKPMPSTKDPSSTLNTTDPQREAVEWLLSEYDARRPNDYGAFKAALREWRELERDEREELAHEREEHHARMDHGGVSERASFYPPPVESDVRVETTARHERGDSTARDEHGDDAQRRQNEVRPLSQPQLHHDDDDDEDDGYDGTPLQLDMASSHDKVSAATAADDYDEDLDGVPMSTTALPLHAALQYYSSDDVESVSSASDDGDYRDAAPTRDDRHSHPIADDIPTHPIQAQPSAHAHLLNDDLDGMPLQLASSSSSSAETAGHNLVKPVVLAETADEAYLRRMRLTALQGGANVSAPVKSGGVSVGGGGASSGSHKASSSAVKESRVVLLMNMVGPAEVDAALESETMEECSKYGPVRRCRIISDPRACTDDMAVRIFVEFERVAGAMAAVEQLNGRWFGGRQVRGMFYPQEAYERRDYFK